MEKMMYRNRSSMMKISVFLTTCVIFSITHLSAARASGGDGKSRRPRLTPGADSGLNGDHSKHNAVAMNMYNWGGEIPWLVTGDFSKALPGTKLQIVTIPVGKLSDSTPILAPGTAAKDLRHVWEMSGTIEYAFALIDSAHDSLLGVSEPLSPDGEFQLYEMYQPGAMVS